VTDVAVGMAGGGGTPPLRLIIERCGCVVWMGNAGMDDDAASLPNGTAEDDGEALGSDCADGPLLLGSCAMRDDGGSYRR
jgi:hypothetical protein